MSLNSQIPSRAAAVTPSDTLFRQGVALYVGGSGDVTLVTEGNDTVTFFGVPAGTVLPIRFTQVKVAGTSATNLVSLW